MDEFVEPTNRQWVEDLKARGRQCDSALEKLRSVLRRGLSRILSSQGGVDEATIEDFIQDALIKIMQNLGSFRGDSKFTTWAMAVAIRTAYTELRRARWRDVTLNELGLDEPLVAPERSVEEAVERSTLVGVMYRIIEEQLTAKQRTALLAELSGVPQAVLVAQLGTNRNALYKLIHDARRRLKQGILEAGFRETDVRRILDL